MITLASATATSSAPPSAFFARWCDHDTWQEWSPDTSWVRLDGPVAQGTTGTLKPTGGPRTRFTMSAVVPDSEYTDTSSLLGARLVFQHTARTAHADTAHTDTAHTDTRTAGTGAAATATPGTSVTVLTVLVTLDDPLARLWAAVMGKGFRESVPADLQRLITIVEG